MLTTRNVLFAVVMQALLTAGLSGDEISLPPKTFDTYCKAWKERDFDTWWETLSPGRRNKEVFRKISWDGFIQTFAPERVDPKITAIIDQYYDKEMIAKLEKKLAGNFTDAEQVMYVASAVKEKKKFVIACLKQEDKTRTRNYAFSNLRKLKHSDVYAQGIATRVLFDISNDAKTEVHHVVEREDVPFYFVLVQGKWKVAEYGE